MADDTIAGREIDYVVVDECVDYRAHRFGRTVFVDDVPAQAAYRVRINVLWLAPVYENGVPGDNSCYGKPEVVRREEYFIPYAAIMGLNSAKYAHTMAIQRGDELLKETQLFIELGD